MSALSSLYGGVARARRAWYRNPARQQHLNAPVISVGNLVVGGSGKTPVVAQVVTLLREAGERPAILSRGYARRSTAPLVVVSEGRGPVVDVFESGDEPQLLARALPEVPIVVGASRFEAGRLAESRFGATVHVLDDGFQHITLARQVNLLLVAPDDLAERVLPSGRLREPLGAARDADAVLVPGSVDDASRVASALRVPRAFAVQPARPLAATAGQASGPVVAVAGIARPERFLGSLRQSGAQVMREFTFRDHYWYTERDVREITAAAEALGANTVLTTEKDWVRLEPVLQQHQAGPVRWAAVPYTVQVEPADDFSTWLRTRVADARLARRTGAA